MFNILLNILLFQSRLSFLHTIYQCLVAGQLQYRTPPNGSSYEDFSWEDMMRLLSDQVGNHVSELKRAKEKVCLRHWRNITTVHACYSIFKQLLYRFKNLPYLIMLHSFIIQGVTYGGNFEQKRASHQTDSK